MFRWSSVFGAMSAFKPCSKHVCMYSSFLRWSSGRTHTCSGKSNFNNVDVARRASLPQLTYSATTKYWAARKTGGGAYIAQSAETAYIDSSPKTWGWGGRLWGRNKKPPSVPGVPLQTLRCERCFRFFIKCPTSVLRMLVAHVVKNKTTADN